MSFDWKTEDFDWEGDGRRRGRATPAPDELYAGLETVTDADSSMSGAPSPHRRRLIAFAVVVGSLLLSIAGLVYLQVERRVSEGRARAEACLLYTSPSPRD